MRPVAQGEMTAGAGPTGTARMSVGAGRRAVLDSLGPVLGLAVVLAVFSVLAAPSFFGAYNLRTILTQTVITGMCAVGMTIVIISGGIDLSVGSLIALATVVTARMLAAAGPHPSGGAVVLAVVTALAACAVCGLVNGLISARLGIVPFIVTLGMMQIARGIAKWFAHEQTVQAPVTLLNGMMNVDPNPAWLLFAPGVWALAGATALLWFVLRRTIFGRYVFALGSNEQAARLCGIAVERYRIIVYTLGGIFAGIAGVMQFANLTVGDPTAASGAELDVIAAVVIGGGSLKGGEGGAIGTLVGALMMAALRNGCNLVGIPNYVQNIVIGAIIIGAVAVDRLKHLRRE